MSSWDRCRGHARHWFAMHGFVGVRCPKCVRCGAPNPKKLSAEEQAEYDYLVRQRDELRAKRAAS